MPKLLMPSQETAILFTSALPQYPRKSRDCFRHRLRIPRRLRPFSRATVRKRILIWRQRRQEASDCEHWLARSPKFCWPTVWADRPSVVPSRKRLAASSSCDRAHWSYAATETVPSGRLTHPLTRRSSISLATSSHMSANSRNSFFAKEFSSFFARSRYLAACSRK